MIEEYIIYQGERFTIEWYYDLNGKSIARDYFMELSFERKKKFDYLIRRMGDAGKIQNEEQFKNEEDQIYAFKPKPDRFLCFFFIGSKIIVTNAFEKKAQKLPPQEKDRALRYRKDYIQRVNGGAYYAKKKSK